MAAVTTEDMRRCAGVSKIQWGMWLKAGMLAPDATETTTAATAQWIADNRKQSVDSLRPDQITVSAAAKQPV